MGALDDDGFANPSERRYVAASADDDNGVGGYLELRCQTGLMEADCGVS
jgi:hypothetical protein